MAEGDYPTGPERTREAILEATLHALHEGGEANVRVAEVAAQAGVTTGAIYGQFDGREGLLAEAHIEYMRRLVERSIMAERRANAAVNVASASRSDYFDEIRSVMNAEGRAYRQRWAEGVLKARYNADLAEQLHPLQRLIFDRITERIAEQQREGIMRADLDPRAIAVIVFGVSVGVSLTADVYADEEGFLDELIKALPYVVTAVAPSRAEASEASIDYD